MTLDDTVLLAYADDELPAAQRIEVEQAIAQSSDLAQRLAALNASVLPYRAAFEGQQLPPVPLALAKHLDDMLRTHMRVVEPEASRRKPGFTWLSVKMKIASCTSHRALYVASFAAGVFCFGIALHLWPDQLGSRPQSSFAQAVAQYHDFYSRETVMNVVVDPVADKTTLADTLKVDGLPVQVPDLSRAGLVFKRIQRLRFNDQPLVQIVYLPARGGPVALCIAMESGADAAVQSQQLGRIQAVSWRRDNLSSVLVGAQSQINLETLAARIAKAEFPPIYASM